MKNFINIYVEEKALEYQLTKKILDQNPSANVISINHYKDVFSRPRQDVLLQKENMSLILAVKENDFLYKGAPVCQDFGNQNFYYSSCVMNCICNCEYCYLKGMYESGNLVVFVNLDDYFANISGSKKYICISYDTDLFPLETSLGYIGRWLDFARENNEVTLEVRTKCKNLDVWNYEPCSNVVFAFSLSPQKIISAFEHKTSNLGARLENIKVAQERGFVTRLCFDPIIYCNGWEAEYATMLKKTLSTIDISAVQDISVGSFRISQSYLKLMRARNPHSKIVNFPFKNVSGYYQYDEALQTQMETFILEKLIEHFPKGRIFLWK